MSATEAAPTAGLVDCDVHHLPRSGGEIVEYLPREWREFVQRTDGGTIPLKPPLKFFDHPDGVNWRLDAVPAEGGPPGSDYELLQEQLLDPYAVQTVHLNWGSSSGMPNGELAAALCRAENDWCAERWLAALDDDRLVAAVAVPMTRPDDGAAEIRRVGANSRFVSALLHYQPFGRPLGHPIYHEIYEAAAEQELPIFLHVNAGEHYAATGPLLAGGSAPNYRFEVFMTIHQPTATHLTSMIVHGVFERYPGLKVLVAEDGLAWLPGFAAVLDSNAALMRRESRWVRRRPSDYFREHVFLATQPCESATNSGASLVEHLSLFEGIERMLCFSSDYPHWDSDTVSFVRGVFPPAWHAGLFHDNARRVLRLP
jgi:uncharacterized protein